MAVGGTAAALTVGPLRPGAGHDAPRFVDETASSGLAQTYGGDDAYDTGGGVAVFDCDGDGRPDVYLARWRAPGGALPEREPDRRRAAVHARRVGRHGPDRGDRGVSARHRQRRDRRPRRAPERRVGAAAGPRRLPLRAGERDVGRPTSTPGNTQAFSATWEGTAALPTMAFGQYVEPAARRRLAMPGQRGGPAGGVRHRVRAADAALARLLPALDALQRLGRVGPPGPPGQQRPPLLRRAGRRGAALAVRAGRAAAGLHRGRRLGPAAAVGHGHRELRPDRRRLPGGLSHQPGREHAPDARRGAVRARLPWHGARARRRGDAAGRRRGSAAVHGMASGVRGRQQRWLHGPARDQGQRRRGPRLRPEGSRTTCSSASRTATFTEASEAAGIVTFDRGRGAALADFNSDGLLDLVVANVGTPARLWRNVGRGSADAAGGRWAAGSASGSTRPARTAMPSVPSSRRASATRSPGASSWSGAATPAASSAGRTSVSVTPRRRRCG